jgi:hypothetical protein
MTPDLLFSYWLFLWYVLYLLNIIKYSPKIWFIIALCYICIATFYMYKIHYKFILLFLSIAFFIKVIPLYTIRKDKYKMDDFLFGLLLVFIYVSWTRYRNKNVIKIYTVELFNGKTPIIQLYSYMNRE